MGQELRFAYRDLDLPAETIIIGAAFRLQRGAGETIAGRIREIIGMRQAKHPLEFRNAGSVFKNPRDCPAGRLIEEAGLKGTGSATPRFQRNMEISSSTGRGDRCGDPWPDRLDSAAGSRKNRIFPRNRGQNYRGAMKKPFRLQFEAKKNRMRLRAGEVLREIGRAVLLTCAIVLVTAAILIGYDFILRSPELSIRETVVKGCHELTEKEILTLAAVHLPSNILTINQEAIARRIRANPWVQDVFVGRELPARLIIAVQERKPVALLDRGNGLYLLDGEGTPFKRLETAKKSGFSPF